MKNMTIRLNPYNAMSHQTQHRGISWKVKSISDKLLLAKGGLAGKKCRGVTI